jgi:hypothetical protein
VEITRRRLRVTYQINEGDAEHPAWRDLAQGATDVVLSPDAPTVVLVKQSRGEMEFSGSGFGRKRAMKNVESFLVELIPQ